MLSHSSSRDNNGARNPTLPLGHAGTTSYVQPSISPISIEFRARMNGGQGKSQAFRWSSFRKKSDTHSHVTYEHIAAQRVTPQEHGTHYKMPQHAAQQGPAEAHPKSYKPDIARVGKFPAVDKAIKVVKDTITLIKHLGDPGDGGFHDPRVQKQFLACIVVAEDSQDPEKFKTPYDITECADSYSQIKNLDYVQLRRELEELNGTVHHHRARKAMRLCEVFNRFLAFWDQSHDPKVERASWMTERWEYLQKIEFYEIKLARIAFHSHHQEGRYNNRLLPSKYHAPRRDEFNSYYALHKKFVDQWEKGRLLEQYCYNIFTEHERRSSQRGPAAFHGNIHPAYNTYNLANGTSSASSRTRLLEDILPAYQTYGKEYKELLLETYQAVRVLKTCSQEHDVERLRMVKQTYELKQNFDVVREHCERLQCAFNYYEKRSEWGAFCERSAFDAGRSAPPDVPPFGEYLIHQSKLSVSRERVRLRHMQAQMTQEGGQELPTR